MLAIGNNRDMQNDLLNKVFRYGILLLSVSSIANTLPFVIAPFAFWWAFKAVMIWVMLRLWDKSYHPRLIVLWMVMVLISCLVGTIYCRDYWDWKNFINNVLNYSICITALAVCVPEILQDALQILYKHFWKLFIALALFLSSDGISKIFIPFSFLALFYPLLDSKYRKYVWLALGISLAFGLDGRSVLLRFLFCMAIGLFSLRLEIAKYARKWYWLFFILPFVFFVLAATGIFNIFQIGEGFSSGEEKGRVNTADTRTSLYEEVIATSMDRGTVLFGNTPARGYYSEWLTEMGDESDLMGSIHYGERGNTEASVLNVFMHFGIFGMIIYFLLFWRACYLGIFRSNNKYMPIIGLCVAFRYSMGWVEDFTNFDLNMFYIWAMIGMCYSPYFREMTDDEFIEWFDGILA